MYLLVIGRHSMANATNQDRFPASLLHLAPPPHTPVVPRSNASAACLRKTSRGGLQRPEYPKPKVADVFLGKVCDVIDSTSEEQMKLTIVLARKELEDVLRPSSQRPALLKHLARRCFPGNWTFESLSQRGGDVMVDGVRLGTGDDGSTFHYADESKDTCFTDRTAQHQLADAMSLADFLAAGRGPGEGPGLYLWLVLLQSKQGRIQRSTLAQRLHEELDAMDWDILKKISELGDLGSLKKLQLFCGVGGTVTACHYDAWQRWDGRKFILFPPLVGAGALLPFPIAHPRDRCARAPLDQTFPKQSHLAHGQGIEVIVEAGDCLFLPQILGSQDVESLCPENLSLSLWLQGGALDRRPVPTSLGMPQALAAELLREWEFYLATHIGIVPTVVEMSFQCTQRREHTLREFLGSTGAPFFEPSPFSRLLWAMDHALLGSLWRPTLNPFAATSTSRTPRRRPLRLRWFPHGRSPWDVAAVALCASWRLFAQGREAWEVEGWPCGRASKKRSGHPRVTSAELRDVVLAAGLGHRFTMRPAPATRVQGADQHQTAKLKGLMKASLARCNALLANDALRTMGHLLRKRQLAIDPGSFDRLAQQLVESSLLLQCPSEEQLEAELLSVERPAAAGHAEQLMARLVTQLLPRWLEEPWASRAEEFRLKLALECWEQSVPEMDVEGTGLYTAVALELGDLARAKTAMEPLKRRDLRLAFQPAFLDDLASHGLWSLPAGSNTGATSLPALVQRAAVVAHGDQSVRRRRHGALLLEPSGRVITEGYNHLAEALRPRRTDNLHPLLKPKWRETQRHAEVHCLLQLPSLKDALDKQILIVEIADVGPGLGWAEPCSRGCVHLLMKFGVSKVFFTDGQGALLERDLPHCPDLDVPHKTFARRISDDRISERAWMDISPKIAGENAERWGCKFSWQVQLGLFISNSSGFGQEEVTQQ
eukprot:s2025_g9.t1